ncbi:restriction endonuclease subunit S [Malaciobacter sp. WC5094]
MSKNMKIPQLRFKEFSGEWEEKRYGDIYSFYSTNSLSRDKLNYENGSVKNIHYGDIHTKFNTMFDIQNEKVPFVNNEIDLSKVKDESYCLNGDLVIADASEDYNDIGKTIEIVNLNNEKVIAGLHTFLARPNKYDMALGFIGYLLQSWKVRKQVMTIAQGTKVLSLSIGRLSKVKLDLPLKQEQGKIASFLTQVDTRIEQLSKKAKLLSDYKKGIMQKIFSQEIRFQDENGKDYPNWEEKKLKSFILNFIVPMRDKPKDLTGNIPWCRIEDFDGKYLFNSKSKQGVSNTVVEKMNLKIYPINTLLVSCSADLGRCAIVKKELITNQTFIGLVPNQNLVDVEFLYYIMKLSSNRLSALSSGTTIAYLSRKEFENFKTRLPSLEEQTKIANFLSSIDTKIEQNQKALEKIKEFKKALLQQMFV